MPADPERTLTIAYARARRRPALAVVWRLDEKVAQIVRTTSEPMIGRMRLMWWREALSALDTVPAPAEPLLRDVAAAGIMPSSLVPIVDGWEVLLDPLPLTEAALNDYAQGRGASLFAAAADALGGAASDGVRAAGRLWALADLAANISDPVTAQRARAIARGIVPMLPRRWPAELRAIGALAMLAQGDVMTDREPRPGSPSRVMRALWHRLSGR